MMERERERDLMEERFAKSLQKRKKDRDKEFFRQVKLQHQREELQKRHQALMAERFAKSLRQQTEEPPEASRTTDPLPNRRGAIAATKAKRTS